MSWSLSGTYVASCSCSLLCPCPVDGPPTGPDGTCKGVAVFHVANGNLDDLDLSGVDFAFYNVFPSNFTSGNWTVGLVVDGGASDAQAAALERILSGQEGGPFGELAPMFGTYLGMERADVSFTDGETPTGSVAGKSEFRFEPVRGADGAPTTVKNAMFGFAPEFRVGRSPGRSNGFGITFEPMYGESADYVFSSEGPTEVRGRI
ncbi:MAG: DUF1326 domain-containing protein [Actinomycetota bacterium]